MHLLLTPSLIAHLIVCSIRIIVDLPSSSANSLLTTHLMSLTEFPKIERIYSFLNDAKWKPSDGADRSIWFQESNDDGQWVSPDECVLHDARGLFKSRLHVLEGTEYNSDVLLFFSNAFQVRSKPSIDDYCSLWKDWENSRLTISVDECQAFWGPFIICFNSKTKNENLIFESMTKVPAFSDGSSDVLLLSKKDVFIPDDLLLKDIFDKSSPNPVFVWYPRKNNPSISRLKLFDIYLKIGVKKISECISKAELSDLKCTEWNQVNRKDVYVVKGLIVLILSFLAEPELRIDFKTRHDTVKRLLNATFFETSQPISMSYTLKMTSGDLIEVSTSQMLCWTWDSGKFISQRVNRSGGYRTAVEYAKMFAEVVSQGLLWGKEELVPRLSELIKFEFATL